MGNLPTRPHRTRCPDGVPWCINTHHPGPDAVHLADVETIDLGTASVGVILHRPVTETDPGATLVRIHYGPDAADRPAWLDLPPAAAAALGQALIRGAALAGQEASR